MLGEGWVGEKGEDRAKFDDPREERREATGSSHGRAMAQGSHRRNLAQFGHFLS